MLTTIFIGSEVATHPLLTADEREAITERFVGRVYWCGSPAGSFDLATLAGRVLARSPEAPGRVVLVGARALAAREWLVPIFPCVPLSTVDTDLDWHGASALIAAVEQSLASAGAEEPW